MKKIIPLFWFAAVFLTIFSSKLWLIDLFGSSLPLWDQWSAEAWGLYIPFFEKHLALKDLFEAHCEHRIFVSRILSLLLLVLNGQWDARLGMTMNAVIAAGIGVALSAFSWKLLGRKHLAVLCLFSTLVFSLPFSWECSLLGLLANYLLVAFALLTIWFLLEYKLFSGQWFLGILFALLSLVTMGSGFCAAASVLAIVLMRAVVWRDHLWRNLIAIGLLSVVVLAGFFLRVSVPGHAVLESATVRLFIVSFGRNLAWPNSDLPWTAFIVWLPSLLLFLAYIFRRIEERSSAEFTLGFGLWIVLQDAALAFARCGGITSRHTVFLCLSLPINFLALLLLRRERPAMLFLRKCLTVISLVWLCNAGYDLWQTSASGKNHIAEAATFKRHLVQGEKNVRAFLQSDNIADLENKPLYDVPFPDPQALALVLRNPHIRAILPSCVADQNKPGPLSVFVSKLIPKGDKLLIIGIALLVVLTGIRFYQSLGTLEKRLLAFRWADFRRLLKQVGVAVAIAALIFAVSKLYFLWSPFGLKVTYFRGINFEQKICSRTEQAVCRDYESKAPAWGVPSKNFSALWEGILRVPETDEYLFFSQNDDGLRLIIDGKKIIDNWCDQSWGASSTGVQVHLSAGDHQIAVEHYNSEGESAL
ncbi:MAG: PA14 domain-containing protein, partial [Kiritimatiellia bacterium]|nr:PA14 domain-containing protein [Kiritimatiellia bacterium]